MTECMSDMEIEELRGSAHQDIANHEDAGALVDSLAAAVQEARAEVERLRALGIRRLNATQHAVDERERRIAELLDALAVERAEVERLRASVEDWLGTPAWDIDGYGEVSSSEEAQLYAEQADRRSAGDDINLGVRRLVAVLNSHGWETCDSGDGATHDFDCDRPHPYVVVRLPEHEPMDAAAGVILTQLRDNGVVFDPSDGRMVQASYSPHDGRAFVEVVGITDADICPADKCIELDSGLEAEIAERDAEDEKTRKPYIRVTYEQSGTWMVLGSLLEYSEDSTELGHVIQDLMRDAWDDWPDVDECDRLIVKISLLTDREAANLPEFPGW